MPTPTELTRQHEIKLNDLRKVVDVLSEKLDQVKLIEIRERLAVLEAHVAELKKVKSEKRHWQFVYIFAGAMASLLATVVQLILLYLKKP